jgi:hypothetical protein
MSPFWRLFGDYNTSKAREHQTGMIAQFHGNPKERPHAKPLNAPTRHGTADATRVATFSALLCAVEAQDTRAD